MGAKEREREVPVVLEYSFLWFLLSLQSFLAKNIEYRIHLQYINETETNRKTTEHQNWNSICCLLTGDYLFFVRFSICFCIFAQNVFIYSRLWVCARGYCMILKNSSDFTNVRFEWKWSQCYVLFTSIRTCDWFSTAKWWIIIQGWKRIPSQRTIWSQPYRLTSQRHIWWILLYLRLLLSHQNHARYGPFCMNYYKSFHFYDILNLIDRYDSYIYVTHLYWYDPSGSIFDSWLRMGMGSVVESCGAPNT